MRRVLVAAALVLALAGCRGGSSLPPADATYSVRGQVMDVPHGADGELEVLHEDVPGFRDRQGKPSHMDSMTMPFAVAPEVSLAGIAPGDKVEMTFEVRWHGEPILRVVQLHELPAGTPLKLGGPTLELEAPLGATPSATPATAPSPAVTAAPRPASDGGSPPPSDTV